MIGMSRECVILAIARVANAERRVAGIKALYRELRVPFPRMEWCTAISHLRAAYLNAARELASEV